MEPREVLLDLQIATDAPGLPSVDDFEDWVGAALIAAGPPGTTELTVRLADEEEAKELNWRYRGNEYATNVLSFPAEIPHGVEMEVPLLGDLIICPAVVVREAAEQGKAPQAHWAHLVVHGVLHLLGFDHENDPDAEEMEAVERRVLAGLGFPDPYANDDPLQD